MLTLYECIAHGPVLIEKCCTKARGIGHIESIEEDTVVKEFKEKTVAED